MNYYSFAGEGEYYAVEEADAIIAEKAKEIAALHELTDRSGVHISELAAEIEELRTSRNHYMDMVSDYSAENISAQEAIDYWKRYGKGVNDALKAAQARIRELECATNTQERGMNKAGLSMLALSFLYGSCFGCIAGYMLKMFTG